MMLDAHAPLSVVKLRRNRHVFGEYRRPGLGRPPKLSEVALAKAAAESTAVPYRLQESIEILSGPADDFLDLLEDREIFPKTVAAAQSAISDIVNEIGFQGFAFADRFAPREATILRPHKLFTLEADAPPPHPTIQAREEPPVLIRKAELEAKPAQIILSPGAVTEAQLEQSFLNEAASFLTKTGRAEKVSAFMAKVHAIKADEARRNAAPVIKPKRSQTAFANPDVLPQLIGDQRLQTLMKAVKSYGAATIEELKADFNTAWNEAYEALRMMTNAGVLAHTRVPIRRGRRMEVWMTPDMRRKIARLEGYVF